MSDKCEHCAKTVYHAEKEAVVSTQSTGMLRKTRKLFSHPEWIVDNGKERKKRNYPFEINEISSFCRISYELQNQVIPVVLYRTFDRLPKKKDNVPSKKRKSNNNL
eukprot:TRINITY_DN6901_c0_g1_i3.p1 TRINITY_DN6901_c0_g1~~TRINITY_DN6901_c0_g1_i3.p1  ORF type:complete len:106 (+),score=27.64 TRINITY_DN6901_c0_g1_i3:43-360(+)